MKKLLFYLAALPILSSAIAGGTVHVDVGNDDGNKIIFEKIEDL